MRLVPVRVKYAVLVVCAVLALAGVWALGRSTGTATQVTEPPVGYPLAAPAARAVQAEQAPVTVQKTTTAKPPGAIPEEATSSATNAPLPMSVMPQPVVNELDVTLLRSRALTIPVQGVTALQLVDTFTQARAGGVPHDAIDIMASRGTPVLAVEDGRIAKLFVSNAGGITLYQFDPESRYAYYYAHLDRYADGMTEGGSLKKGQVIGYVGSTGNASPDAPHLHFAIFKLEAERQWWRGAPLNPYLVWREAKP